MIPRRELRSCFSRCIPAQTTPDVSRVLVYLLSARRQGPLSLLSVLDGKSPVSTSHNLRAALSYRDLCKHQSIQHFGCR